MHSSTCRKLRSSSGPPSGELTPSWTFPLEPTSMRHGSGSCETAQCPSAQCPSTRCVKCFEAVIRHSGGRSFHCEMFFDIDTLLAIDNAVGVKCGHCLSCL